MGDDDDGDSDDDDEDDDDYRHFKLHSNFPHINISLNLSSIVSQISGLSHSEYSWDHDGSQLYMYMYLHA